MTKLNGAPVFVTGGAGFIGSYIVEGLVRSRARVKVYDNFSSGRMDNLEAVRDELELVEGDILDYERLRIAMKGAKLVSHQAAQLEILKCVNDPVADLQSNTVGTLHVLRAAVENKVEKIIAASSACVYGQAQALPQTEEHPTEPNWAYGVSKLAAEKYCRLFQEYYRVPITMLRYAIIYGPREWYGRVLTIFIKRALQRQPLVIFGNGEQVRDFTFVEDVARMHNLCLSQDAANGKVYNVSTGRGTTVSELADLVAKCAGCNIEIIYEDLPEGAYSSHMPERVRLPAELKAMVLSSRKAHDDLSWVAQTDLREGIRREIEWVKHKLNRWHEVHI
jgi:UDP-glucose 4-epimerase